MSTAHIYGDPPEAVCTEESATGHGFAPFVARAWEEAFHENRLPPQRPVVLRTSFVLGRDRGAGSSALTKLQRITRLGLGGRVGSGRQGLSWIHETDLNRLIERGLTEPSMRDAYIASSPEPVSQCDFMRELRKALGVPLGLPAPGWLVRLGAPLVFRTDPELALYGRYVVSKRLAAEGFEFRFPSLREALQEVFGRRET
jgi:NAD dependent epimerase/dehydratase family enzyme